jgi:hypothetical protein
MYTVATAFHLAGLAVHVVNPHSHESVRSLKILFCNICKRLLKFNTGKYDAIIPQTLSIYDFYGKGYDTMAGEHSCQAERSKRLL